MASIWFGDLGDCFINVPDDITGEKAKKILDSLYEDWTKKYPEIFKDFRPVFITDNGIVACDEMVGFDEDEYSLTFVSQGVSNHYISWGSQKYAMGDNEIIKSFTNDLLKRLGMGSELIFSYQVIADDGYENCSINVSPNFENKFPDVEDSAYFYPDYGQCELCDDELAEDDNEICESCDETHCSECHDELAEDDNGICKSCNETHISEPHDEDDVEKKLEGLKICFTGEMKKQGIYEMAQEAIKLGATWDKDIAPATNILVKGINFVEEPNELWFVKNSRLNNEHTLKEAKEFKTKILSEGEFYELIKE